MSADTVYGRNWRGRSPSTPHWDWERIPVRLTIAHTSATHVILFFSTHRDTAPRCVSASRCAHARPGIGRPDCAAARVESGSASDLPKDRQVGTGLRIVTVRRCRGPHLLVTATVVEGCQWALPVHWGIMIRRPGLGLPTGRPGPFKLETSERPPARPGRSHGGGCSCSGSRHDRRHRSSSLPAARPSDSPVYFGF